MSLEHEQNGCREMGTFFKIVWYIVLVCGVLYYTTAMFKGGTVTRRLCSVIDKDVCYKIADDQDDIHSRILAIVKKWKSPKEVKED
jgi:hypothetical protein